MRWRVGTSGRGLPRRLDAHRVREHLTEEARVQARSCDGVTGGRAPHASLPGAAAQRASGARGLARRPRTSALLLRRRPNPGRWPPGPGERGSKRGLQSRGDARWGPVLQPAGSRFRPRVLESARGRRPSASRSRVTLSSHNATTGRDPQNTARQAWPSSRDRGAETPPQRPPKPQLVG